MPTRQDAYNAKRRTGPYRRDASCQRCAEPFVARSSKALYCNACKPIVRNEQTRARYDPARERIKRDKRMRAISLAHSDLTVEHVASLYRKAKRCTLCRVRLNRKQYDPACAELDHIVPINVGGTHTIGNVRIICRSCNGKRPDDGSDVTGQPTLWATDINAAAAVARRERKHHPRYQPSKAEWVRETRKRGAAAKRAARQEQAALVAADALAAIRDGATWEEAAARYGRASGPALRYTISRHLPAELEALDISDRRRSSKPDRALEMRRAGHTWSHIARTLGYSAGKQAARAVRDQRGIDLTTLRAAA